MKKKEFMAMAAQFGGQCRYSGHFKLHETRSYPTMYVHGMTQEQISAFYIHYHKQQLQLRIRFQVYFQNCK